MTYTELFTELLRAEIEMWNTLDDHLRAEVGVTLPQFQSLAAVGKLDGSARVQDISEEMSITVGATSKLVDRLERDGHATRQANPGDRRSSIVVLTDLGRQLLAAASTAAESHLGAVLAGSLPAARAAALTAELSAVRAGLKTENETENESEAVA